jgi:hypothetical protein
MPTVLREKFLHILQADVKIIPGIIPRGVAGGGTATDEAAKDGRVQAAQMVAN